MKREWDNSPFSKEPSPILMITFKIGLGFLYVAFSPYISLIFLNLMP